MAVRRNDFVPHSATRDAERVLAESSWFGVTDVQWSEFAALLDEPLGDVDELAALLRQQPAVDVDDL